MALKWLVPVYGFHGHRGYFSVPAGARSTLEKMGSILPNSPDLVALYVTLGAEDAYNPDPFRGRVAAIIKLLTMPGGRSVADYSQDDIVTGEARWPYGWPFETVYAPRLEQCPSLRDLVEETFGRGSFIAFAGLLHAGPVTLADKKRLADAISRYFPTS